MVKEVPRAFESWLRPDSLALKWFWPGFRAVILPFLLTLSRFAYDLFVFIKLCVFDYYRESFGALFRLIRLEIVGYELENPVQSFLKEVLVEIL